MTPAWPTVDEVLACDDPVTVQRWVRFLSGPTSDEQLRVIDAVLDRYRTLRDADPAAMVAASKAVGW